MDCSSPERLVSQKSEKVLNMQFHVTAKVTALVCMPIEADSEEDARAKAGQLAVVPIDDGTSTPTPPQQCWIELSIPDNEILVLDAIEEKSLDQLNES